MPHKPLKMSLQEYKKETFVDEGQFVWKAMHCKSIHKMASIISDSSYVALSPIFKYQIKNRESPFFVTAAFVPALIFCHYSCS
jgi:hypothetical protein